MLLSRGTRRHKAVGIIATAAAATAIAAFGGANPALAADASSLPGIAATISDRGIEFVGPDRVMAGTYRIRVKVDAASARGHEFQLVELHPGYTLQNLIHDYNAVSAAFESHDLDAVRRILERIYSSVDFASGSAELGPGGMQQYIATLRAGNYAYFDFDARRLRMSKAKDLTVFANGVNPAVPVPVSGTVRLFKNEFASGPAEFGITTNPRNVLPHTGKLYIRNTGNDEPHFLVALRLKPGKHLDDVLHGDRSAIEGVDLDTGWISPNRSMIFQNTLQAGFDYVLACFVPDPDTDPLLVHAEEGMVSEVHVQ